VTHTTFDNVFARRRTEKHSLHVPAETPGQEHKMAVVAPLQITSDSTDHELFTALRDATPAQRERIQEILVRRHHGFVQWLVSRYANPAIEREELLQVALTGLVLAIQRFDPDHGSDFVSFARPTVQGEIRRWFRDKRRWIRLPRRLQEAKAVLRDATEKLTHDLQRAPTVAELAAYLAVDEELILEAMTADDSFSPLSLDSPVGQDDSDSWTLAESIADLDNRLDHLIDFTALRPLLAGLAPREQQILHLRFFEGLTQAEIGERIGLSQMHVSRLLARTLSGLREQLMTE
jgi:RNA polymerase sigma-B factor